MSAAVMSSFCFPPVDYAYGDMTDSNIRVQNWMLAQMASPSYTPLPHSETHHYNALYPVPAAQQHADGQEHGSFNSINQSLYPKAASGPSERASPGHQIHSLAHDLQQHTTLGDQQRQNLAQVAQHMQQHSPHGTPSTSYIPVTQQANQDQSQKPNRLRKACDSCSIRKVKCDEAGPPCRACAALDIPCTFERPSRRRGPPNRHAEAIKRRKLEEGAGGSPHMSATSAPSSPTTTAPLLNGMNPFTSNSTLSAESICPDDTLNLLIDDFFTYIHPLCPFPHEPSFREAWRRRDDLHNKPFLSLLASMLAMLVASFPRKPRLHLKAHQREKLFPNHMSLVLRCQKVCTMARGAGYLESDNLNVYDAVTSYFLALADFYTFRYREGRLYLGECLTIIRTLGLHKVDDQGYIQADVADAYARKGDEGVTAPIDHITREMSRRLFWTVFVSVKSLQQMGAAGPELVMPPPTSTNPYPPLPAEVDDFCIYPTHIEPQPADILPVITGFIANVRVYSSYNPLATMELAWGIDAVVDWDRQKKVMHESLRRCKDAIEQLSPELKVDPKGTGGLLQGSSSYTVYEHFARAQANDPTATLLNTVEPMDETQDLAQKRQVQKEIQKANVYGSALCTRSYIVEKYWNLCEAFERSKSRSPQACSPSSGITAAGLDGLLPGPTSSPDSAEVEMREERERIVRDLLVVLGKIDVVNMEPNADSFIIKIRSIAGTLLDAPDDRRGRLASDAQSYLSAILKILMKLERRVSTPGTEEADDAAENEEAELRTWADLREHQMKFAQQALV